MKELANFEKKYDREAHQTEKVALINAQTREAETKARFQMAKERQATVSAEIERLQRVREEMKAEFQEKERLEKICEATKFIRDTLKEAAPRVARNYVFHISNEANQLFREITGNAERTLKWGEDYGIILEEYGLRASFCKSFGRRTNGGGFVGSPRAFETTFRCSDSPFLTSRLPIWTLNGAKI